MCVHVCVCVLACVCLCVCEGDDMHVTKSMVPMQETKAELQQIKERYNETCQQLANTTRNLTDTVTIFLYLWVQCSLKTEYSMDKCMSDLFEISVTDVNNM